MVYLISTFLLLSLARFFCWWTFSPRVYHPPSSLCLDTDMVYLISMLLFLSLARYFCWWTFSPRVYHPPSSLCLDTAMVYLISPFLLLSLCRYLCWWTFSPRVYHPPVVCVWTLPWYIWYLRFYYYHCVDTSVGELLVPECIIHQVVCVWDTDMVYLISTFLLLSLCRYLCWWTFSLRVYHPPSSLCLDTAMVYLISMLLLLSLARYFCWWTFSPRVYHPPSSLC
jgi:hypothetical protein